MPEHTSTIHWQTGFATPILPVADMSRTVDFWQGLGFLVVLFRDGGYGFATSSGDMRDVMLHFSLTEDLDPFVAAGMAYVNVSDVDAVHEAVMATGLVEQALDVDGVPRFSTLDLRERWDRRISLARATKPWDQPWNMREFALWDPDNNLIRIGQNI